MKLAFALVLAVVACGDNNAKPDGQQPDSGSVDAPMPEATLTTYVIDLVTNHTTETESPRASTEFLVLPDPDADANNRAAYSSLF